MSLTATSLAVLALMIPHLVSAAPVAEQALPPLRESFAKRYGYDYGYSPPNPVIIILPIIFGIFIFVAIVSICVRNNRSTTYTTHTATVTNTNPTGLPTYTTAASDAPPPYPAPAHSAQRHHSSGLRAHEAHMQTHHNVVMQQTTMNMNRY